MKSVLYKPHLDLYAVRNDFLPILDQVIPVPDLTELEDQRIQELSDAGFTITNFHSGGVFHTLLMIVLRIQIELLELCRTVLNQMFVSHASGAWLDLKMSDYSKTRKLAQKTQGVVTVSRTDTDGEAVKIPKGHIFKSIKDINGDELPLCGPAGDHPPEGGEVRGGPSGGRGRGRPL